MSNLLAADGNSETDGYGGVYDKTTISRLAKVPVAIVQDIEQ